MNCIDDDFSIFDISLGSLLIDNTRDLFFEVCSVDYVKNSVGYVIRSEQQFVSVDLKDVSPVELNVFSAKQVFGFREVALSGVLQQLKLVKDNYTLLLERISKDVPFDCRIFGQGVDFDFQNVVYVHDLQKIYMCVTGDPLFKSDGFFESPESNPLNLLEKRTYRKHPKPTKEQVLAVIDMFRHDRNNTVPAISKKLNLGEHQVHKIINRYEAGVYDRPDAFEDDFKL